MDHASLRNLLISLSPFPSRLFFILFVTKQLDFYYLRDCSVHKDCIDSQHFMTKNTYISIFNVNETNFIVFHLLF